MRARNIKPGFYRDADLAECSAEARLIVPGLWMMADREGRLIDNPKQIKMELFPCDNWDCQELLSELENAKHIIRYTANGQRIIKIRKFLCHQNPHKNEPDSTLPDEDGTLDTLRDGSIHYASDPADSLIPDSLIPDSLIPDNYIRQETDLDENTILEGNTKPKTPPCPHQKIQDIYHEVLPELRKVRAWTPTRQKILAARWKEDPERQDLEWWKRYFGYVRKCPFLMGKVQNRNGSPPFEADLEWLIRPANFVKVIEGKYEGGHQ